jgi:hypothetical protein
MGMLDLNVTIDVTLIVYLVTYLIVNGFLLYLLVRLRNTLRGISAYSKNNNVIPSDLKEISQVKTSLFEIHRLSAHELDEIEELKQSLFDIQNTVARQLSEINKLKQSLSGTQTVPGASPGSGSAGMRIARNGTD